MSRRKDRSMTDINKMNLRLMEDEEVLYVARPGRRMDLYFLLIFLSLVALCVALYLLGAWGMVVNVPAGGIPSISVASIGVVGAVAVVLYRFIVMGHAFVLTNRRVIVLKGGKFLTRKFLSLTAIGGAEINQGLLYRAFGLATIDFFSPSSQPKVKTILIILSFSSTSFKFIYLTRKDAEAIYTLLCEQLEKIRKK
ncbi:MAG: PH domain-containing protein [Bacilli bacterium]|nr:PH domain-containing protein [Bacilli bacterium]